MATPRTAQHYPAPPPGSAPAAPYSARAPLSTPKTAEVKGTGKDFERELAARVVVMQRALELARGEVARLKGEARAAREREEAAAGEAARAKEELAAARRRIAELEEEASRAAAAPPMDPLDEGWMERYLRLKSHALRLKREKEIAEGVLRESLGPAAKWPAAEPAPPASRPTSAPVRAGAQRAEEYLRAATRLVRSLAAAAAERAEATAVLRSRDEREAAKLQVSNLASRANRRIAALERQLAELKAHVAQLEAAARESPRKRPAGQGEEESEEEAAGGGEAVVDLFALLARHVGGRGAAPFAANPEAVSPAARAASPQQSPDRTPAYDDETEWSGEGDPEEEYDAWLRARDIKPKWQEGGPAPPVEEDSRPKTPRISKRLERLAQGKAAAAVAAAAAEAEAEQLQRRDEQQQKRANEDFHAAFSRIETEQRAKWAASEREAAAAAAAVAAGPASLTARGNRRRSTVNGPQGPTPSAP